MVPVNNSGELTVAKSPYCDKNATNIHFSTVLEANQQVIVWAIVPSQTINWEFRVSKIAKIRGQFELLALAFLLIQVARNNLCHRALFTCQICERRLKALVMKVSAQDVLDQVHFDGNALS